MGVQLKPVTREKVEPQAAEQKEGAISKVFRAEFKQCCATRRYIAALQIVLSHSISSTPLSAL